MSTGTTSAQGHTPAEAHGKYVRAAQAGERAAFDELVERHFGMVYAVALARLEDSALAQDLAQEVFLRAYLSLNGLENPDAFPGWIASMARNLATDWQRRGNLGSRIAGMIPLDSSHEQIADTLAPHARAKMESEQTVRTVHIALHKLPPDQREIVLLHFMEGVSQEEIAQRLGIHRTTVSRALKLALSRLRGLLVPALQSTMPSLRAPSAATARTIAMVGATACLAITEKAALAAKVAAASQAAAVPTSGSGITLSLHAAIKTIIAFIKPGGILLGSTKGIAVTAAAILTIGGGAYYVKQQKEESANLAAVTKAFAVPAGDSLIPPPRKWKPYRDWNELATEYLAQNPGNVGLAKLVQALGSFDSNALVAHRETMNAVLANGWNAATPQFQNALQATKPAVDLALVAAQSAPFELPATADATVPIPPFATVQQLNKAMLATALQSEAAGDIQGALQRAVATAYLSQSFCTTGSILISHMIGTSGLASSANTIATLLRNPAVTPQMATAVLTSLQALDSKRTGFPEVVREEARFTILTARLVKNEPAARKKMDASVLQTLGNIKSLPELEKRTDLLFRRMAAGMDGPVYSRPRLDAKALQGMDSGIGIALPNMEEAVTRSEIAWAKFRLCQALAAQRAGVPVSARDPFADKSLTASTDKFYSVGPDAIDQKGSVLYDATNGTFSTGDIVVMR